MLPGLSARVLFTYQSWEIFRHPSLFLGPDCICVPGTYLLGKGQWGSRWTIIWVFCWLFWETEFRQCQGEWWFYPTSSFRLFVGYEFPWGCQVQGTPIFVSLAPLKPLFLWGTLSDVVPFTHLITEVSQIQVSQSLFPETLLLVLSGNIVSLRITKLTERESQSLFWVAISPVIWRSQSKRWENDSGGFILKSL